MSKKSYNRATKHNRVQALPSKIIKTINGQIILYDLYMMK